MPTFGGLLKRKKTKESSDDKSAAASGGAGYQSIQYKSSHKSETPTSPVSSKIGTSNTTSATSQATTTTVTSSPDPNAKASETNGDMNIARIVSPQGGTVDGKGAARQTKGKYTLTDFTMQRTLGTGSFGRVHLVQSKHNQRFYAVKVLKKQQVVKMKQIEHTNDERKMLQRVKHPFLITLWGTFQDSRNLYMVMDFIEGGELFSLLRKSQVLILTSTWNLNLKRC